MPDDNGMVTRMGGDVEKQLIKLWSVIMLSMEMLKRTPVLKLLLGKEERVTVKNVQSIRRMFKTLERPQIQ